MLHGASLGTRRERKSMIFTRDSLVIVINHPSFPKEDSILSNKVLGAKSLGTIHFIRKEKEIMLLEKVRLLRRLILTSCSRISRVRALNLRTYKAIHSSHNLTKCLVSIKRNQRILRKGSKTK